MTAQRHKRAMNLAIDHLLDTQERQALHEHLDNAPADAALWERMKRADRMLRSAPLIPAPTNFAERVIAAITAGKGPKHDPRFGLGIALGMMVVAVTAIPLFSLLMIGIVVMLQDQVLLANVLAQLNAVLSSVTLVSTVLTEVAAQTLQSNLLLVAVALLGVPLTVAWVWMLRTITAQPRLVTYRIPVRATA